MKLSDKIFLGEAAQLLKVPNKPSDHVIHWLMNEEKLTTYFDVNVDATESDGYAMRPINQDGDDEILIPYVDGAPTTVIEGPGKKILEADVVDGNIISVLRFTHDDKLYCGAEADGFDLKPIVLGFDDIYFERSDISAIQDLPSYQDKSHEHYAPEIDLAIQLHKAIHYDKHGNQAQSREDRIVDWLRNNRSDQNFSNAAIERLSAIIGIVVPKKK